MILATIMDGSRNFLGQKHTMKHLKAGEVQLTKFAERSSWENWERNGMQTMADHAIAEAEKILREHRSSAVGSLSRKKSWMRLWRRQRRNW